MTPAPDRQVLRDVRVFDSAGGSVGPLAQLVIEAGRVAGTLAVGQTVDDARVIDGGGRVVLPGLIDAHVHVVAASHDLVGLALQPPSLVTAQASAIMRGMLHRGFTTVRDAAGADFGWRRHQQPGRPAGRHPVLGRRIARRLRGGRGRQPVRDGPCLLAARRHPGGAGGGAVDRTWQADRRGQCPRDEGPRRYLVPTLSTYAALADEGPHLGWSAEMLDKLARVQSRGLDAVRIALAEGVPVVFGTDLLGYMHDRQSGEFDLRLQAMGPVQALQSATLVAARLLRAEADIGHLRPGARAYLLLVDGDPTTSLAMLTAPDTGIRLLMQGGRTVRNSL